MVSLKFGAGLVAPADIMMTMIRSPSRAGLSAMPMTSRTSSDKDRARRVLVDRDREAHDRVVVAGDVRAALPPDEHGRAVGVAEPAACGEGGGVHPPVRDGGAVDARTVQLGEEEGDEVELVLRGPMVNFPSAIRNR